MFGSTSFVKDHPATLAKMSLLLRAGAIADYRGSETKSSTPLYWSVDKQDLRAVELLLEYNADPNQLTSDGDP
jgi:ankyrin repeat protein